MSLILAAVALMIGHSEPATRLASGTIEIDLAKPGPRISRTLYGVFLEEINNAIEGGLYAEMIQNRGFEDANLPPSCTLENGQIVPPRTDHFWENRPGNWTMPWNVDTPHPGWTVQKSARTRVDVVNDRPLTKASAKSLRVDLDGTATICNEGFWGIGVKKGETYNLSLFAQCDGNFSGPVRAAIIGSSGKVLAEHVFNELPRNGWKKIGAKLKSNDTDAKARFILNMEGKGKAWFDFVSLFPTKTYKNRPNGLRLDLVQKIIDLKPGFIRYPGGCYVEGLTVETRPRWEETIGPVEERVPTYSPWGYWSSNGFGYHEWLQFCEDTGADALYVFNVGVSCAFRSGTFTPDEELPALIQNTLDGIEYAIGPTTSKWGALRAKNGHPKPFPLKYVEIGNEQSGARYGARVKLFTEAIKKRFPEVKVILSSWIAGIDQAAIDAAGKIDIVDEHAYTGANWALANYDHFSKYPRNVDWDLYIGEFATNSGVGRGNMQATLGDAAYMMSMEKNSDLVKMGSYAPLFENINRRQWEVNLIHYDNMRSFGRASFYACKMFADHRPDVNLPTKVDYVPSGNKGVTGPIGLGTYATVAEFKDIRLVQNGRIVEVPTSDWSPRGGKWSVDGGVISQTTTDWDAWTYFGSDFENSTLTLKARKIRGEEGFVVSIGNAEGRRVQFNVGGWRNRQHGLEASGPIRRVDGQVEEGRWYDVKVESSGRTVRAYLDGVKLFEETLPRVDVVRAISGLDEKTGEVVIKVLNPNPAPANMTVRVRGRSNGFTTAEVVELGSTDLKAENTFENPTRIAPVTRRRSISGTSFTQEFPANSITVIRLKGGR